MLGVGFTKSRVQELLFSRTAASSARGAAAEAGDVAAGFARPFFPPASAESVSFFGLSDESPALFGSSRGTLMFPPLSFRFVSFRFVSFRFLLFFLAVVRGRGSPGAYHGELRQALRSSVGQGEPFAVFVNAKGTTPDRLSELLRFLNIAGEGADPKHRYCPTRTRSENELERLACPVFVLLRCHPYVRIRCVLSVFLSAL